MANTKTARKEIKASRRRQARNRPVRTLAKTRISKAEKLIFAGEVESAQKAVAAAITTLDKAAEKRIIHPNNAARRKSRLVRKLNSAQKAPASEAPAPKTVSPEPEK